LVAVPHYPILELDRRDLAQLLLVRGGSRMTGARPVAMLYALRSPELSYASVDKLQKMLAAEVFGYAADKKKASGRALGTLVEIITFYTLCAWKLRDAIAIGIRQPRHHPQRRVFAPPDRRNALGLD
jgi:hypothetical protein